MTATDNTVSIHEEETGRQAAVRTRLDEIWDACAARDYETLESFHLYGPKFTAFKDCAPRTDGHENAAAERAFFEMLDRPVVDMRDLAINLYGEAAVVTFNGHFTGAIHGNDVAVDQQATLVLVEDGAEWRIVHEHMSPLGAPPAH